MALAQVALQTNIPLKTVKLAYRSYWAFIRNKIKELPLKENLSEEEFKELRTNFNLPSLGKLYVPWDYFQGIKKRTEYLQNLRNDRLQDKDTETSE